MRSTTDRLQRHEIIVTVFTALACGVPSPDSQTSTSSESTGPVSTETTTTDTGSSTVITASEDASNTSVMPTSQDTSGSESGSGTGSGTLCPDSQIFECSVPVDCTSEYADCGGLYSWVGPDGCPRIDCLETPCPDGTWCHSANHACGVCVEINIWCEDVRLSEGLRCSCGGGDGSCGGSFCIGNDEYPQGSC